MFNMPLESLGLIIVGLLLTGVLTGFLAGLLGIGAGTVVVPVLVELFLWFDVPEIYVYKLAVGSSLAIMIPTSLRSFNRHRLQGSADTRLLLSLIIPILIGVLVGGVISRYGTHRLLESIFAGIIFCMGLHTLIGRASWCLGNRFPQGKVRSVIGLGIGTLSSIMGIGGGLFLTVFMRLFGSSMHRAVATSSGVGVMIAIPGFVANMVAGYPNTEFLPFLSVGYVNFLVVLAIIPTSMIMAPVGAAFAYKLSDKLLSRAFSLFLFCVVGRFVWRLLLG